MVQAAYDEHKKKLQVHMSKTSVEHHRRVIQEALRSAVQGASKAETPTLPPHLIHAPCRGELCGRRRGRGGAPNHPPDAPPHALHNIYSPPTVSYNKFGTRAVMDR